jgi:iron complex outermembrane receptor protein
LVNILGGSSMNTDFEIDIDAHDSKRLFTKKLWVSALGLAVLAAPIQEALAQLEEIVVTSRRYEESITDAPLAVAVMDAEYIRELNVQTVQDVLNLSPGSEFGQFAKAQPRLTMRGISGNSYGNSSLEHAVSVVTDGVPVTKAFMMTLPVFDQERVEVLRGPQGSTFGRNATLGLVHYISARPSQESSGHVEFSAGERDLIAFKGHISGGLSDTVSGRLALNYTDTPGQMDDEVTGDPVDYSINTSLRASLLIEPSDSFSAYLKFEYMEDEEFPTVRRGGDTDVTWLTGSYASYVSNADPWKVTLSPDPEGAPWVVDREMYNLTAELVWTFDNDVALTSITGYLDGDHYSNSDAFGTPYDIRDQLVWNDATEFSQEFRVDNHGAGNSFRWLFGVSYLTDEEHRIEKNESEPLRGNCNATNPTACPRNSILITEGTNTTDAYGVFGELVWDLGESWTLAVGGRYSNDSRTLDYATDGWGSAGGLAGIGLDNPDPLRDCNAIIASGATPGQCGTEDMPVGYVGSVKGDWDDFSPKVSLTWAVSENSNIYALYSEGFKGGGFQQDARWLDALFLVLDQEDSTNIELGWKGTYDTIIFAVTAFMQEQTGIHTGNLVAVGSSQSNLLVNAKGIENAGLELEATWAPTDSLTLGGNAAFYDPKFMSGTIINGAQAPDGTITGGEDVSGQIPANNVKTSAYLFASYDWAFAGGSSLRVRADVIYRDTIWGQNGANNRLGANLNDDGFMYLRPEQVKPGLRIEWASPEAKYLVALWGRNLDDEPDYINYGPPFGYVYLNGPGDPAVRARAVGSVGRRQIGATFTANF